MIIYFYTLDYDDMPTEKTQRHKSVPETLLREVDESSVGLGMAVGTLKLLFAT
jgi:hypothetical protein